MLPRFGGHPNTTEGGGHNAENTSSLCTRSNELRRDRADIDDRHPADPAVRDGQAGLPACQGIAPIRQLNVTRG